MQVKLYVFESVSDAREFERTAAAESAPARVLGGASPEPSDEPKPVRHYRKHKANAAKNAFKKKAGKGFGIGSQPRKCKRCGEPGHRSDTCPQKPVEEGEGREEYDPKLSGEELHAAIQGLKEDGLDSFQVTKKLKIPYSTVMENWD